MRESCSLSGRSAKTEVLTKMTDDCLTRDFAGVGGSARRSQGLKQQGIRGVRAELEAFTQPRYSPGIVKAGLMFYGGSGLVRLRMVVSTCK